MIPLGKVNKRGVFAIHDAVIKELGKKSLTFTEHRDWNSLLDRPQWSTMERYFYNQLVVKMTKRIGLKAWPLLQMKGDFIAIIRHLKKIKAVRTFRRTLELRKQGRI